MLPVSAGRVRTFLILVETNRYMQPYIVRQRNSQGEIISEKFVEAVSNESALRQVKEVVAGAQRLEVYNDSGAKVREIGVSYWQQKIRRR